MPDYIARYDLSTKDGTILYICTLHTNYSVHYTCRGYQSPDNSAKQVCKVSRDTACTVFPCLLVISKLRNETPLHSFEIDK